MATRLNFEVSELRKTQIKTYVSMKNITIKELFDRFLTEMFGPEPAANAALTDIQDLTEQEASFFAESDQFFADNPQLCDALGFEEAQRIAQQVKEGASLATLLGYENVK